MVRGKFLLQSTTQNSWDVNSATPGRNLKFVAFYDQSIPEDQKFSVATPSGSIEMYVTNPAALASLELGKFYYVDFSPVPEPIPQTQSAA